MTFDPNNDPDEYEHIFEVTFTSGSMGTHASTYTERGMQPAVTSGHFKITDWVVPGGMATAGAAAFVTSLFVPDVAAGNQTKCTRLGDATSRDVCRLAAGFLAREGGDGPTGLVRNAVDWARDKPAYLADRIDRGKEVLDNVAGELLPDDAIDERQDTESLALETPRPVGGRVSGEATGPDGAVVQVEGDITLDGDFAVTAVDDINLSVVISGSVGNDGTANSGEVAPALISKGTLSLRGTLGNVVVAGDTTGDAAEFEWGADSGEVRSVRSTTVLSGSAPVVVRKIVFVRTPRDSPSVTLDLSEYFMDPNGDPMRFTAVAGGLDVRVSGSVLSIRPNPSQSTLSGTHGTINTRVRVTATDPGGLAAEMSFHIKMSVPPAVLWTYHDQSAAPQILYSECEDGEGQCVTGYSLPNCGEYVILDMDAYERQVVPFDNTQPHFLEGLKCPSSYLTGGGCHRIFDWGIHTLFTHPIPTHPHPDWWVWHLYFGEDRLEFQHQEREACLRQGFRWNTHQSVSTESANAFGGIFRALIRWLQGTIRQQVIESYELGSRRGGPRKPCQCVPLAVRG